MKNRFLLGALLLVIVTNGLVLAGAAWNRRGEPDATVTLTERELAAQHGESEDSGIYLRLTWHHDIFPWFDAAKLNAIGYDTGIRPDSGDAERFYRKALPRRTFVVLEYEGDAWQAWIKGEAEQVAALAGKVTQRQATDKEVNEARKSLERKKTGETRLFPVDAGNDPRVLRSRYPDRSRYLIAPAQVRLVYESGSEPSLSPKKPPAIHGRIDSILVAKMAVPQATAAPILKLVRQGRVPLGSVLPEVPGGGPTAPRFKAIVTFGRRYEPWVVSVAPL